MITRRKLVTASLAAAAGASVSSLLPSRRAEARMSEAPILAQSLAPGLWMFSGAGGNVVVGHDTGGLVLVDGGRRERSRELLKRIARVTGVRKVKLLFNTHWHWDHTGSNEILGREGIPIVAHENTRLWLTVPVTEKWENRTYPPLPKRAQPTQTFFYGTHQMSYGPGHIAYGYLPQAHTDGDLFVHFPAANVIVAGDVVSGGSYPLADYCTGGWLGGMIEGLQTLMARSDDSTRIVPGTGPLRTRADLKAQHDMCLQVLTRISRSYYKGQTWQQLLASAPTREFDAQWGDPSLFLKTAYEGAWLHINEIRRYAFPRGFGRGPRSHRGAPARIAR